MYTLDKYVPAHDTYMYVYTVIIHMHRTGEYYDKGKSSSIFHKRIIASTKIVRIRRNTRSLYTPNRNCIGT